MAQSVKNTYPLSLLVALFILSRFLLFSETPYEWDSVNYAKGFQHFSLAEDQPHAPGSILYILLGKVLLPFAGDPIRVQLFISLLFGLSGLLFCYRSAKLLVSRRAGLLAALFCLLNPVLWFYGIVAEIYAVVFGLSAAIGYFLIRLTREKSAKAFFRATFLLGLAGGFRLDVALFLFPLWIFLLLYYARRSPSLPIGRSIALLLLSSGLWFVPTLVHCGGLAEWLRLIKQAMSPVFLQESSLLYGASLAQHVRMAAKLGAWLFLTIGVPGAVALFLWYRSINSVWDKGAVRFFILWMLPALLFFIVVYIAKPGYLMILLPPAILFISVVLDKALRGVYSCFVLSLLLCLPGIFYFFSPGLCRNEVPYQMRADKSVQRLFRYTLNDVRYRDRENRAFCSLLRSALPETGMPIFIFSRFSSWSFRTATYYFPDVESHLIFPGSAEQKGDHLLYRYRRMMTLPGEEVWSRGREIFLFPHPLSPEGRELATQGIDHLESETGDGCFRIPSGHYASIRFSTDHLILIPERKGL
ncbi:MAG: hypothetical protein A2293_02370 [Elusimicrobia bacterium RIFOXYB2_FULL_49_7]|nr:MAG: hypothetical protein A2293_02370 [Elusimicrobia bacterium RIFOXYB2_FULL_49_7]